MSDQSKGPQCFRPVVGYEDQYEVNSYGEVRNLHTRKYLKPQQMTRNGNTYLFVNLYKNGKFKATGVHRVVAFAFLKHEPGLEVNHKDKNTFNNCVDNLEWVTRQKNMEHALSKTYFLKSPEGIVVEVFNLEKFARENGLDSSNLSKTLSGKRKHHRGWTTINV